MIVRFNSAAAPSPHCLLSAYSLAGVGMVVALGACALFPVLYRPEMKALNTLTLLPEEIREEG
jgi:hypothetical protein